MANQSSAGGGGAALAMTELPSFLLSPGISNILFLVVGAIGTLWLLRSVALVFEAVIAGSSETVVYSPDFAPLDVEQHMVPMDQFRQV